MEVELKYISGSDLLKALVDLLYSNADVYTKEPEIRKETISEIQKSLLPYIEQKK